MELETSNRNNTWEGEGKSYFCTHNFMKGGRNEREGGEGDEGGGREMKEGEGKGGKKGGGRRGRGGREPR